MRSLIVQWNDPSMAAIWAVKRGPPTTARSLGVVYTAIFDAWPAFDDAATQLRSSIGRRSAGQRTDENREPAFSMAAFRALTDQSPSLQTQFAEQLVRVGGDPSETPTNITRPSGSASHRLLALPLQRFRLPQRRRGDLLRYLTSTSKPRRAR